MMKTKIKNLLGLSFVTFMLMGCNNPGNETITLPTAKFPGPQHGSDWVEYDYSYKVHKPWNVSLDERYNYDVKSDEHTFRVFKDDEPFKQGDHTSPRCEIRILNDYTEGNQQFEADYYISSGSYNSIVMQIFGSPIAFNMRIYEENGGTFKWFETHNIDSRIYDRWVHVNVVHMFRERKIYVYIDGFLKGKFSVKEAAPSYYFKCGAYTCLSEKSEVKIKNIKCYKQK